MSQRVPFGRRRKLRIVAQRSFFQTHSSPSSNNPHTATLSPHFNRTLITLLLLLFFALSSNRVRNLVSFFFEMPYPNRVLNDACVSVNSTCFAFFAIDFSAETFNAPGVDGLHLRQRLQRRRRALGLLHLLLFVVVDVSSRVGRKNVSLPESEARSVNKFTAAARDSSLSAIGVCARLQSVDKSSSSLLVEKKKNKTFCASSSSSSFVLRPSKK